MQHAEPTQLLSEVTLIQCSATKITRLFRLHPYLKWTDVHDTKAYCWVFEKSLEDAFSTLSD